MSEKSKIIIAGGTGYIGKHLTWALTRLGYHVVILSRSKKMTNSEYVSYIQWNPSKQQLDLDGLDNIGVVINLAGKRIDCVFNKKNQKEILESRINSVKTLDKALQTITVKPKLWIQASAAGYYGNTGDKICKESDPTGNTFLADVCSNWEKSFFDSDFNGRKVCLRIGPVFGSDSIVNHRLAIPVKLFFGGQIGNGKNYLSWIHIDDLIQIVLLCINNPEVAGAFNATSPEPCTNKELMRAIRKQFNRPWSPPAPVFMVKLFAKYIFKLDPSLLTEGQRCSADLIQSHGLKFRYGMLIKTIESIYGQ